MHLKIEATICISFVNILNKIYFLCDIHRTNKPNKPIEASQCIAPKASPANALNTPLEALRSHAHGARAALVANLMLIVFNVIIINYV